MIRFSLVRALVVWPLALTLALFGCKRTPAITTPSVPRKIVPLSFSPTLALPGDQAFHAQVDRLAAQQALAMPIGRNGQPHPDYTVFLELTRGDEAALLALLRHQSPLVRGYTVRYLLSDRSEQAPAVAPLFL